MLLSRVVEDAMKNGNKSRQKKTRVKKGLYKRHPKHKKAAQKKKKKRNDDTFFEREREREKKKAKQQKP